MAAFHFSSVHDLFSISAEQTMTMNVMHAFMLAGAVFLGLILLGALATMAGRWLSKEIDRVFEWLLLMALGAMIAYLLMGGYLGLH